MRLPTPIRGCPHHCDASVSPLFPLMSVWSRGGNLHKSESKLWRWGLLVAILVGVFFRCASLDVMSAFLHKDEAENGIDALNSGNEYYRTVINRIKQNFTIPRSIICAFGKMTAGKVRNAVASECKLEGTFRTFFKDDREKIKGILERTASEISKKNGVKCELKYLSNYSAVKNNKFLYDKLKQNCATLNYKFAEAEAVLAGEDFGFLTDKYKGLLFWLGARGDKVFDLHSSSFLPDKKAIDVGIDVLASFLRKSENKIG